jgi:hypothetical protein
MSDVHRPATPRNRGDYDAPHQSPVTPAEDVRSIFINQIAWSAVLAGVVISLVVHVILNMIGVGIGASTLNPTAGASENPSVTGFSIGAGIWWTVAGIIAAAAGGYAAGRLSGTSKESTAAWHGLTAWALTTLVILFLIATTIGGVVGGAFQMMGNAAGNVASATGGAMQTAAQTAGPALVSGTTDPFSSIEQSIRGTSGGNDPAALRDAAIASVRAAITGDPKQANEAKDRAAQAMAKAQNISVEEARTRVDQYEKQYRQTVDQAKQRAAEAADTAARAVSRGALFGSLALLLGALAGWFGGWFGAVEPTITRRRM